MKNERWLLILSSCVFALGGCASGKNESALSSEQSDTNEKFLNGDFESGDLSHWTAGGLGAFGAEGISSLETLHGVPSLKEGQYFFSGSAYALPSYTGSLTSDDFMLNGLGLLSFRMGAASDSSKIFLQFFKKGEETPLSFLANGGTEKVTSLGNMDFNGTTLTDQMVLQYVDLSDYVDETIHIVVTDNDTRSEQSDYSYVNLDGFRILQNGAERGDAIKQRTTELAEYADNFEEDPTSTSLRNGGFESGDLSGWKVLSGSAFDTSAIATTSSLFWEKRAYYGEGSYFFNGELPGEKAVGSMRSEKFTLEDKTDGGFVSFLLGGGRYSTTFVSVIEGTSGAEIARVSNKHFKDPALAWNLHLEILDLSAYKGKVLYFKVVDERAEGDFGALTLDDFRINLTKQEVADLVAQTRMAASTLSDATDKATYETLYQGGESFPLAGEKPTIQETNGLAFSAKAVVGLPTDFVAMVRKKATYGDDYTAQDDLKIVLTSLKQNGNAVSFEDATSVVLPLGDYQATFTVEDLYGQTASSVFELTVANAETTETPTITNGDFETGDMTGWEVVSGSPNFTQCVSSAQTFWNEAIPYNAGGTYHFDGWAAASVESDSYSFRSTLFKLSGSGAISFKMAGRSASVRVYRSDGTEIAFYKNTAFQDVNFPSIAQGSRLATLTSFVADLSAHVGESLYLVLADESITENWAVAFFDDVSTYYETMPVIAEHSDTVIQDGVNVSIPWLTAANSL